MRKIISLLALMPTAAFADPLDKGEAYTTRQGPPEWMDGVDLSWLLVDYGIFALMIVAIGWVLTKRITAFERFESVIRWPFSQMLKLASHLPIILRELAQGITGLIILFLIVAWVIFCQWLKHQGLGAISMAGLALEAVILVRLIKQGEKPPLVSQP
ncbi:MAG: hypothetical protein COW19_08140 [Zetaproteobacteria bacterium CG12_big_fil_rev_8_21_14_0_65_55_1124]|nr:MAG: hypothetical protein AUJ58_03895 [Zetaproteobacteria bacterium CG1_02_55_237]PIS20342.1 MAG: hypothetical protein COT53_01030 [Zetaproteobacteria bacterium CG08_land_8_20_14_0_20_55_17]PIW42433.1 MAG: hypothetical protein COW19_08140 [Zetaproteobacteria bacterium CG12_big_fil_rev_8_21_14_0_65_55_1124]PIY52344.1 MAG: hypothetical protein COZ01_08070 [Zetaproteobacteria bacterium CG_4_10_14_0_8_um_filter_55_43]PIZ37123.1 MAG: hypothetical protein COY36_10170 [Zetaproteobacteria bacterium 